jgi:hypothetical protein
MKEILILLGYGVFLIIMSALCEIIVRLKKLGKNIVGFKYEHFKRKFKMMIR